VRPVLEGIRSAAAQGEDAHLVRARKGWEGVLLDGYSFVKGRGNVLLGR
jgi:hypothetical protein